MIEIIGTKLAGQLEILSDSRDEAAHIPHAHLEVVVLDARVGEHCAYAVLAETGRMDMQVAEQVANRREDIPVALQLDDDELSGVAVVSRFVIVEMDVEVDGESFCLAVVDQCHSVE